MVCSVDARATDAGLALLDAGGSAADATIAANAVLAVTTPHMCGMGGDLFALVHQGTGPPFALNASGRAGSGADPERLRGEGRTEMPFRGDVRAAPVPGCVDGWAALHARCGRRPWAEVLSPARELAEAGFEPSPLLMLMLPLLDGVEGCEELTSLTADSGRRLRRPGVARTLAALIDRGRDGFYDGEPGRALLAVGHGEFDASDLARSQADWVQPLGIDAWGHRLWTIPPNSQGYLTLTGCALAERLGVSPGNAPAPDTGEWAHVLVESARLAAHDRLALLHEHASGPSLVAPGRLNELAGRYEPGRRVPLAEPSTAGGTMYLCAVDATGMGVSLIQSNASGFGCHVALPGTGVLLHNRGIGFSLEPGHPAEYGPGRRPPHTLSPALVARHDGSLRTVIGTMGGDSQPQILLQLLARLLVHGEDPGAVIGAPRWVLSSGTGRGFDTWADPDSARVELEPEAPGPWAKGLGRRGHPVHVVEEDPDGIYRHAFGHAHLIEVGDDGERRGAADPRAQISSASATRTA